MDTATVALVAAGIGAGGGIAGQVFASIFTARRETERLKFEKDRYESDAKLERQRLFVEQRRDLFATYLSKCRQHSNKMDAALRLRWRARDSDEALDAAEEVIADYPSWTAGQQDLLSMMVLLAPDIEDVALLLSKRIHGYVSLMTKPDLTEEDINQQLETVQRTYLACRMLMQSNLGLPGVEKRLKNIIMEAEEAQAQSDRATQPDPQPGTGA